MPQTSIGSSKALLRPTFQCTPRFSCIRCFSAEQIVFSCKVLAVLCFCSQRACLNLGSLVLRWINKNNDAADTIDDTEAHKNDTAAKHPIMQLRETTQQPKKPIQPLHTEAVFNRHAVFKLLVYLASALVCMLSQDCWVSAYCSCGQWHQIPIAV